VNLQLPYQPQAVTPTIMCVMLAQLLSESSRQLTPVEPAVGMVKDMVAIIVGLAIVRACQAVERESEIIPGMFRTYKDVLAPAAPVSPTAVSLLQNSFICSVMILFEPALFIA
jgi:hypothetical protein